MDMRQVKRMIILAASIIFLGQMTVSADTQTGGFSNATGSNQQAVVVKNLDQLQNAFNSNQHHIIIAGSIYAGNKPITFTFADKKWDNTTIEGQSGTNPTLVNIQLKFDGEMLPATQAISNIVVKNITFNGVISDLQKLTGNDIKPGGSGVNYEGISLRRINNAWISHNDFHDMSDDLFSISLHSDNITVSNNRFWFSNQWLNMNPNPNWNWIGDWHDLATERLTMVVGANGSDSYMQGGHKMHVTMHDNWFGPNLKGRPLLRGYVHVYNNYFDNSNQPTGNNSSGFSQQQYNALQIGSGSYVLSENNTFYKTNNSHLIGLDKNGDAYKFLERNNIYNQVTGTNAKSNANASEFSIPYHYSTLTGGNIQQQVTAHSGPFK
ncbi:pectate lyase [Leuconostoc holzapfelii]|uniref:Pectate lyase n=1 Tax=Leuconostoc holzapfelii TaxID=434464 RepID=A0ABT2NY97_9LACO|nr:hypothetical protein [Leuconostoc holzapfelii]MCT8389565.1 pectate lyase [Leuconostoc holzapfelii]